MSGMATATLVQVEACTNAGGITKAGTVDVHPLVNQVDGYGNAVPHGTIYGLPYIRIQGGANAVIMDPVAGDIGIAIFASHDISSVKATGAQANPGSRRRFDWADGIYLGGLLNGVPTQYVDFASGGITLLSPTKVTIQAPDIELVGAVHTTGAMTADSTIVAQGNITGAGTSLHTHLHSGVTTGGGNTGAPV